MAQPSVTSSAAEGTGVVTRPVESRKQRKQFLNLPWTLYRDDPNWVPPLRVNQKEMVGYKHHPFYGAADAQTFLAYRGKEVCGRISAIVNHAHNEHHKERRGFFGFFECVDDQQVANSLFDAACEWLRQHETYCVRGPMNPSLNYEIGMLVDGFDTPPTFMIPYNAEYYPRLVEGYGFEKWQDLYSYKGSLEMLPAAEKKMKAVAEQIIERFEVKLRTLDRSKFVEDVETFISVYNRAMADVKGFVPMSTAEVRHLAAGLKHLIAPDLTLAAEIDGRVVGAVFGVPDYNPRIRKINGRLFPFGFITLLTKKRQLKRVRLVSTNVIPEYQRYGVGLAMMHGLVPLGTAYGMEEAEFSWVMESNLLSRGSLEKGGAIRTKTHRLYDLDFAQE